MKFFDEVPANRTSAQRKIDWESAKQALTSNPERWGLMAENVSSSTLWQLRKGKNKSFRGADLDSFEFRTSRPDSPAEPYGDRRTDLYGRFVGSAS